MVKINLKVFQDMKLWKHSTSHRLKRLRQTVQKIHDKWNVHAVV